MLLTNGVNSLIGTAGYIVWGRPGTLERFLGRAHHHVTSRAPIETYTNNHMIAELAEPRIGANVPRPFPRACVVGSGNETTIVSQSDEVRFS